MRNFLAIIVAASFISSAWAQNPTENAATVVGIGTSTEYMPLLIQTNSFPDPQWVEIFSMGLGACLLGPLVFTDPATRREHFRLAEGVYYPAGCAARRAH